MVCRAAAGLLGWAERRNKSARLLFNLQTAGQQRGICKSVVNLHELFCLQFGGVQQTGDHWWLLWRPSNMSPAIMNTTRCLQSDTCCRMGSQVQCTAQCASFSFDINSLILSKVKNLTRMPNRHKWFRWDGYTHERWISPIESSCFSLPSTISMSKLRTTAGLQSRSLTTPWPGWWM